MTFKVVPPEIHRGEDPRPDVAGTLFINGEAAPGISVEGEYYEDLTVFASIDSWPAQRIVEADVKSLPTNVDWWVFEFESTIPSLNTVEVSLGTTSRRVGPCIRFRFEFNLNDWKRDWSVAEYRNALEVAAATSTLTLHGRRGIPREAVTNFALVAPLDTSMTIALAVERWLEEVRAIHLTALQNLELGVRSDSIVLHFDFPERTRAAAEQYLLYFAEFLRDVGVEAEAEVRERAGTVLFAVKPVSGREALAQVGEALALYLSLPSADLRQVDSEAEIAIDKLVANIHHLQGQLRMAAAVMKAQQATIAAQEMTISYLQPQGSGSLFLDSVRPKDREEILGGTVAITKYQGRGFELDLPSIFRLLRDKFRPKGR